MKVLPVILVFLSATAGSLQADLLANWRLDDAPGTTGAGSVLDSALGLHPGTPDPGTTFGGAGANANTGTSANFAASRIGTGYATALNPNRYTISAWARTTSTGGIGAVLSSRSGNGAGSYIIYKISNRWEFWTGNAGGGWNTVPGAAVIANTWTHLAATFDGSSMEFFVDGVSQGTTAVANYGRNLNQSTFIGRGGNAGTEFAFDGDLDDVAVFDRVLDAPTINQVMTSGAGSLPQPMLLSLGKSYAYGGNLPGFTGGTFYFDDPHPQSLGTYGTGDLTDGATYSGSPTANPTVNTLTGFDPGTESAEIILDLEGTFLVSQIRLGTHTWSPFANGAPDDVTVSFSTTDDAPGSFGNSILEAFSAPGTDGHHDLIVPVDGIAARYVKVSFDGGAVLTGGTPNKYMLDELSVYGLIPEPSTFALLLGGLALLCYRQSCRY